MLRKHLDLLRRSGISKRLISGQVKPPVLLRRAREVHQKQLPFKSDTQTSVAENFLIVDLHNQFFDFHQSESIPLPFYTFSHRFCIHASGHYHKLYYTTCI